jgi:type IV secretion system protein VirB4
MVVLSSLILLCLIGLFALWLTGLFFKRYRANKLLSRQKVELEAQANIPWAYHVTQNMIKTDSGEFLAVIKCGGASFSTADQEDIDAWHQQLNSLIRNITDERLALWTHLVRRQKVSYPEGRIDQPFASSLKEQHKESISEKPMRLNEMYLTVLFRPTPSKAIRWFSKLETNKEVIRAAEEQAQEKLKETLDVLLSGLRRYHPALLSTYKSNDVLYSQPVTFLSSLVNGDTTPRPVSDGPINLTLPTARLLFGREMFECRGVSDSRIGAILAIREYPAFTRAGILDELLSAPLDCVLAQSFTFVPKASAVEAMTRQQNRMKNSGDLAHSQINEINHALDDLVSSRYVMGRHNLSLMVYADDTKSLKQSLSETRSILSDQGIVSCREDLALEAAFWAQIPGNFSFRPRISLITSRNFVGFTSPHNYPSGRIDGNQWGPAVTVFRTESGSPYYFNFHQSLDKPRSNPADVTKDSDEKVLGNTFIVGPSGSGKTVLQTFLLTQLEKFKPKVFFLDKDRGAELAIRAVGGKYFPMKLATPTGFNPFQLDATPQNIDFCRRLITKISELGGGSMNASKEMELNRAINVVFSLPRENRGISQILELLDPTDPEGTSAYLQKWVGSGANAWVFDNKEDSFLLDNRVVGVDLTQFLDIPEIRTPINMYLLHRMEELIDGGRFTCIIDEFWKALGDPDLSDWANDKLKVIRKQNGLMVLGTQSAADAIKSPIFHTINEQCPTQIFFPNGRASKDDYVTSFNLTEREYLLVKEELGDKSRKALIKQGGDSVVVDLSLPFGKEMEILSGTTGNVELLEEILEGQDQKISGDWLQEFYSRRELSKA